MRNKTIYGGLIIFLLCSGTWVQAQHAGSPYTIVGLGSIQESATTYNALKGGVGISNGNSYTLNNLNPALLALNTFTIFDFGVQYDQRRVSTDSVSQLNKGGGLNYLSLAIPIKTGKIATSLTLSPYSIVKYNLTSIRPIENDTTNVLYRYNGDGGLNQIMFQVGARPFNKRFLIGAKVGYLFGSRNEETTNELGVSNALTSGFFRVTNYNGFYFGLGAMYSYPISEKKMINVGVTYDLPASINSVRTEYLGNRNDIERADTVALVSDEREGKIDIPQKFAFGISYAKEFNYSIEFNYQNQNWNDFSNFYESTSNLGTAYKLSLGGDFTPDFYSVNNYLERITYLAGLSYDKTPLSIEDEDITDFGINFGVSLPVGNGSTLNLGFTYGQMGKTSNNLLREEYYKISLGISFNDRAYEWYRKQRKLN